MVRAWRSIRDARDRSHGAFGCGRGRKTSRSACGCTCVREKVDPYQRIGIENATNGVCPVRPVPDIGRLQPLPAVRGHPPAGGIGPQSPASGSRRTFRTLPCPSPHRVRSVRPPTFPSRPSTAQAPGLFPCGSGRSFPGDGNRPVGRQTASLPVRPPSADIPSRIGPPPIPGTVAGYGERPLESPSPWSRSSADALAIARLRTP